MISNFNVNNEVDLQFMNLRIVISILRERCEML